MKRIAFLTILLCLLSGCVSNPLLPNNELVGIPTSEPAPPKPTVDSRLLVPCPNALPQLEGNQLINVLKTENQAAAQYASCAANHAALANWVCGYLGQTCPSDPSNMQTTTPVISATPTKK